MWSIRFGSRTRIQYPGCAASGGYQLNADAYAASDTDSFTFPGVCASVHACIHAHPIEYARPFEYAGPFEYADADANVYAGPASDRAR